MDILLLGVAALVLVALTLWIVWRPASAPVQPQEAAPMLPQGDAFEDQYTSATADLSAGGVAVSTSSSFEAQPPERAATDSPIPLEPRRPLAALPAPSLPIARRTLNVGAATLLTLGGAIGGAFLYARWQQQRNRPLNRLRRRFR
jgi:hypothetical protein